MTATTKSQRTVQIPVESVVATTNTSNQICVRSNLTRIFRVRTFGRLLRTCFGGSTYRIIVIAAAAHLFRHVVLFRFFVDKYFSLSQLFFSIRN